MTDWKTGEPPEDGWYWALNQDGAVTVGYYDAAIGWDPMEPYTELNEDTRWQGPLVPPYPPTE